jgi:hypothetical protein
MAGMTAARLSENRKWIVCGACGEPLCQRARMDAGVIAKSARAVHILLWAPEWRNDRPGHVYRGPRVRKGWIRTLGPRPVKSIKSFPFDTPALCPRCGDLNRLDADLLDVVEAPSKDP